MIEEAFLPVRAVKSRVSEGLRDRIFQGLHPGRYGNRFGSEAGKQMDVVGMMT